MAHQDIAAGGRRRTIGEAEEQRRRQHGDPGSAKPDQDAGGAQDGAGLQYPHRAPARQQHVAACQEPERAQRNDRGEVTDLLWRHARCCRECRRDHRHRLRQERARHLHEQGDAERADPHGRAAHRAGSIMDRGTCFLASLRLGGSRFTAKASRTPRNESRGRAHA